MDAGRKRKTGRAGMTGPPADRGRTASAGGAGHRLLCMGLFSIFWVRSRRGPPRRRRHRAGAAWQALVSRRRGQSRSLSVQFSNTHLKLADCFGSQLYGVRLWEVMMRSSIRAINVAFCLFLTLALGRAEAAGPFGTITVGNWRGGAYTDDKTGAFAHCAAGATYQSHIYFMVSMGQDFSWAFGFAHEDWQLTTGQAFPLAITFDGQQAINVEGMPIGA